MTSCLIVDDSMVVRKVARKILEDLDFQTAEAENGAEAMASCQDEMPDVILLDWYMPVMNGVDFLLKLRGIDGGERPLVIFCTTENDISHIQMALAAGANEYIMKPFDSEILQTKLQQIGLL